MFTVLQQAFSAFKSLLYSLRRRPCCARSHPLHSISFTQRVVQFRWKALRRPPRRRARLSLAPDLGRRRQEWRSPKRGGLRTVRSRARDRFAAVQNRDRGVPIAPRIERRLARRSVPVHYERRTKFTVIQSALQANAKGTRPCCSRLGSFQKACFGSVQAR